jgi:hypothetical protein
VVVAVTAQDLEVAPEDLSALNERFAAIFGRQPGHGELVRFRAAEAAIRLRIPRRGRRREGRLIARA